MGYSAERASLAEQVQLILLSVKLVGGRWFWAAIFLPLAWPAFLALGLVTGWLKEAFGPADAMARIIGLPLAVLAIGLGVRIIAVELSQRTIEISYTVPGGGARVWLARLLAALGILLASEALLGLLTWGLFTAYPAGALYGAFQGSAFYLVLSAALAAFFKGELAGAMGAAAVLVVNALATGLGSRQLRISPFWNPLELAQYDPSDVLAWTVQNRIAFALAILALAAMAFARAERREEMLKP